MKLIIAEKEAVAKSIVEYFKSQNIEPQKKGRYYENDDYYISWASGHLLKLKEPDEIDPKLKKWTLEDLPIFWDKWEKKPIERTEYLLNTIKDLLTSKDVTEIINAADPDEEGSYLIDEILEFYNNKKPVKRLLINDTTIGGIKNAFKNIEDNENFVPLSKSAYARAISDNLLGINLSRYFSLKNSAGTLSIGRVQTPTLAMIVARDKAIRNHTKEKYYEFYADTEIIKSSNENEASEMEKAKVLAAQNFHDKEASKKYLEKMEREYTALQENYSCRFKYHITSERTKEFPDKKIKDKTIFEEIKSLLKTMKEVQVEVTKEYLKENPPLPFNLMRLQVYCSNKFNYSPDEVMKITQSLRDNHSAITYNRSDCEYLSSEQYKESPETISKVLNNLGIQIPEINFDIKSKAFNDENITAHTAIIPTNIKVDLEKLTEYERNVYKAIADHYIIQFLPNALKEKTEAAFTLCDKNDFKVTSNTLVELGYKAYLRDKEKEEEEEKEKSQDISKLLPGTYTAKIIDCSIEEKETKPLKKYTEATIMSDMCSISKYIENPEIRAILRQKDAGKKGENGSIGTPATRSEVLNTLYKRGYIEKQGKNVVSTKLGEDLINILPKELISAEMTANWWLIQEKIKGKEADENALILDVLNLVKRIISQGTKESISKESKKEPIGICPICKKNVYERKSKSGKVFYSCEGYKDGCQFTLWEEMKYFDNTLKITKTRAKNLIAGKKVSFKLTGKNKKEYEGYLKLKISDYNNKKYINFENAGYPDRTKK